MPGWTLRELDCTHCGGIFTDMEGDLFLPVPRLCDECLIALWNLSEEELINRRISIENIRLLQTHRENRSLEEILAERSQNRGR